MPSVNPKAERNYYLAKAEACDLRAEANTDPYLAEEWKELRKKWVTLAQWADEKMKGRPVQTTLKFRPGPSDYQ